MRKFSPPLTLGLSCIAYGLVVLCALYFAAQAHGATDVCNIECVMQKMDALNEKTEALDHSLSELTVQINKSIKTGQTVTLHTEAGRGGGCLTYIGPSGD
jgi:hypothetical protein